MDHSLQTRKSIWYFLNVFAKWSSSPSCGTFITDSNSYIAQNYIQSELTLKILTLICSQRVKEIVLDRKKFSSENKDIFNTLLCISNEIKFDGQLVKGNQPQNELN